MKHHKIVAGALDRIYANFVTGVTKLYTKADRLERNLFEESAIPFLVTVRIIVMENISSTYLNSMKIQLLVRLDDAFHA